MILSFLTDNSFTFDWGYWSMIFLWVAIFTVCLFIEFNTADITTIWFCVSALVCFILALFDIYYIIQICIFALLSIILVFATKPLTKNMMNKTLIRTNADRIISEVAIVTKKITNDTIGEVKIGSELWRAISHDDNEIEVNEKVTILSFSGNKVVVSKINKPNNIEIL